MLGLRNHVKHSLCSTEYYMRSATDGTNLRHNELAVISQRQLHDHLMPGRLVIDALTGDVILRFLIANKTEYVYVCSINGSVTLRNTLSRSLFNWQDISGLT